MHYLFFLLCRLVSPHFSFISVPWGFLALARFERRSSTFSDTTTGSYSLVLFRRTNRRCQPKRRTDNKEWPKNNKEPEGLVKPLGLPTPSLPSLSMPLCYVCCMRLKLGTSKVRSSVFCRSSFVFGRSFSWKLVHVMLPYSYAAVTLLLCSAWSFLTRMPGDRASSFVHFRKTQVIHLVSCRRHEVGTCKDRRQRA